MQRRHHLSMKGLCASIMIAFYQGQAAVAQLLVRKIPDDVMRDIRTAAKAEGLSMEEFARQVLTSQVSKRARWLEFFEWSKAFTDSQRKEGAPKYSTTKMIREDRRR